MPTKESGSGFAICVFIGIVILAVSSGGLFILDGLSESKQQVAELGWMFIMASVVVLFSPDILRRFLRR